MLMLKLVMFVLGALFCVVGLPTLGGALIFSVALNAFCDEFGRGGRGGE